MEGGQEIVLSSTTGQEKRLGIDPKFLEEARQAKSPEARFNLFYTIYDKVLDQADPDKPTVRENRQQSSSTLLNIDDLQQTYELLFSRKMVDDVPELGIQFKNATERHQGNMIPQREISAILGVTVDLASSVADSPGENALPSKDYLKELQDRNG